jgi:putative membrane-bound dehydrogenase-like protein
MSISTHVPRPALCLAFTLLALASGPSAHAEAPRVPEGFSIRLVAAVPAVSDPSQVATAPDGSLFIGEDPMDQAGPADKPIDRILVFRPGKEPVVFAEKLNAIFGMVWHEGALYVMNMPHLTVLRDTDGDGKADRRKELFTDLGVPAGQPNNFNDHIVSGLKIGIDGRLYISVGDKGVPKATGPDGRTAQVVGGGILRCRVDGTELEVFSTGTRNHLEPNLDAADNMFTYDNTDDGLGWWTRVTHQIDGGYHGYPYDYHDRTDRILPRMAEYGGGSPCGGVLYADDVWPEKYRGRLFWAEWGKRSVRAFRFEPDGASFKVADVIDFVEPGDVSDFRPLDLALSHDGKTMYIADWSFGGWANKGEKLGRVYAVTFDGADRVKTRPRGNDAEPIARQIAQLDHPAFQERRRAQSALIRAGKAALAPATAALADPKTPPLAKRHLAWVLDGIAGGRPEASLPLIQALGAPSADVRAQAARALGERAATVSEEPLVALLKDADPKVRLQAIIALGRIGDASTVPALIPHVAEKDVYVAYSARKALERIDDWKAVARGLASDDPAVRGGILLAMERIYDQDAVRALADFIGSSGAPAAERARAVRYLASVHRKARPWNGRWWGTQPARNRPPARTIPWPGTKLVLETVRRALLDRDPAVRAAAVSGLSDVGDGDAARALRERFPNERDAGVRKEILHAFGAIKDRDALPILSGVLRDRNAVEAERDEAIAALQSIGGPAAVKTLIEVLRSGRLSDERAQTVIASLGRFHAEAAIGPLLSKLDSRSAALRATVVKTLAEILRFGKAKPEESGAVRRSLRGRLGDASAEVRNQAAQALALLEDRESIPALIALADPEETRFAATHALTAMPDMRALQVYLRGLADRSPELRKAAATAVGNLRDQAAPVLEALARRNELPANVVPELRTIYSGLEPVASWKTLGPFPIDTPPAIDAAQAVDLAASVEGPAGKPLTWKPTRLADSRGQVDLGEAYSHDDDLAAYGYAEVESPAAREAQMAVGSDDTLTVWLNGKQVYAFNDRRAFSRSKDRADVSLLRGKNRVLILCGNRGGPWQYSVAFTGSPDYAFLKAPSAGGFDPDRYRAEALKGQGSPEHGRAIFNDLKGLACVKCHSVGKEGGAVGPELSSVGAKYPRDELITAVLSPSAKISSGYEPTILALTDGRIVTGIVKAETTDALEVQDENAKLIRIPKDDVEDRKRSDVSIMPTGLAQGISPGDFADLIRYLETLREPVPASAAK